MNNKINLKKTKTIDINEDDNDIKSPAISIGNKVEGQAVKLSK
jgi:hypothetical protein